MAVAMLWWRCRRGDDMEMPGGRTHLIITHSVEPGVLHGVIALSMELAMDGPWVYKSQLSWSQPRVDHE